MTSIPSFFHPLIGKWFRDALGGPSDIQDRAWPIIAEGKHVLVTAPTGSGKTLTAFLWSLHQLITGSWSGGTVRVLYVSPLKALNNDVQRNLLRPLAELREVFLGNGEPFPDISVLTRSGDTPGEERRRMLRRPPEILITTPESLNLLLTSKSGRSMLTGVTASIIDEVHAVVGNKRGTHLITALDRLVLLSGDFQRIALSATVNPLESVAAFVGGYVRTKSSNGSSYQRRPVSIIKSDQAKGYELTVSFPAEPAEITAEGSRWPSLIRAIKNIIAGHRSTLLFTNSRRTAEKVTRLINEGEPEELAYAHHGSLSRELRLAVEQKLKQGELKAIVATNSLELGIDIGTLDRVILVQTPRSVSSSVQRVGRSGHGVGEKSRGTIFPTHGRDFLDAAVMARAVIEQDIEAVHPVEAPLDILAQVVLSMTSAERWDIGELYAFLKTSYPFHTLSRRQYDSVLEMLNGRYSETRLRELKARVSIDRIDNTIEAQSGVPYLIYSSGGTIPDRGYFDLRLKETRAKIGELDEEFVWERSAGETFALGSQLWRIDKITHNDVEVLPVHAAQGIFPFWRAEEQPRDFHFSGRIGDFLEQIDGRLDASDLERELRELYAMDAAAANELIEFLKRQKQATGTSLPHRHHVLIEYVDDPVRRSEIRQVIVHTFWGGRVNQPFALALAHAWEEREHSALQVITNDDALLLMLPRAASHQDLFNLVTSETVEIHFRRKLEQSGIFGARFRENAERALLLPKSGFKRRMPLWLMRLRARDLFTAVHSYGDFPILLETWRSCLKDEFDLENLKNMLDEVHDGRIRVSATNTVAASPFAGGLIWKQTNEFMYQDDRQFPGKATGLRQDLVKELIASSQLRPQIPVQVISTLESKLQRTASGYAPASARELLDWIRDRVLIPEPEWRRLKAAIAADHEEVDAQVWLDEQAGKIGWLSWPGVRNRLLAGLESLPKVLVAFRLHLDDLTVDPVVPTEDRAGLKRRADSLRHVLPALSEEYDLSVFLTAWLSFFGPVSRTNLAQILGITSERLDEALEPLIRTQNLILDRFSAESTEEEVCDSQNLEILLRMARAARRPSFTALPSEQLPLFLALYQGIVPRGKSMEDLQQRLEQLFGWPAQVNAWEEYILPARMQGYRTDSLDSLMHSGDALWFGCGQRSISLAFRQDLDLFQRKSYEGAGAGDGHEELDRLIPDRRGRYSFFEIMEFSKMNTAQAGELLWKEAWKGHVTSDTFQTLRKGVVSRFTVGGFTEDARLISRRSGFDRWKVSRPVEGHWLRIDDSPRESDLLEEEELAKDRIRQLLRRYGVLFRDLVQNELPLLQWPKIFRSLRLMELSGEILSGYFFEDIPGPQFISSDAFRLLQHPLPQEAVFWINAVDPASLCGSSLVPGLPARLPSTFLVYRGSSLVMTARRSCRFLEIFAQPYDPFLSDYFGLFKELLTRQFNPLQKVTIEIINNEQAVKSVYAGPLKQFGFRPSRNILELWKQY